MRLLFSHDCDTASLTSDRAQMQHLPQKDVVDFFSASLGRFLKVTEFSLSIDRHPRDFCAHFSNVN